MSRITVLGLGAMGSRMAHNLLAKGHVVTVWNRSPEKAKSLVNAGAIWAQTPREAVEQAEVVISMVRDDEASRQVWLEDDKGALVGLSAGSVAIESSTLSIDWMRELGQHFSASSVLSKGIDFVEAPVVGSRPQAELAQLVYLVGGDSVAVEHARPILMALGRVVHHVGPVGSGAAMKLAVNGLFGIQAAAMGELIGFLRGNGLAVDQSVAILTDLPVCSPGAKALADAMVARQFAPMFPIALVEKDLGYALSQQVLPMLQAARSVFTTAIVAGHGEQNITGIAQLYD